jgi:hypothetical protein
MNTATIANTNVTTDSAFRRALRTFLSGLRASLEFTGRAYMNGHRPL